MARSIQAVPSRAMLASGEKIKDAMATPRNHRFRLYDITSDTHRISRAAGPRDSIELPRVDIMESPVVEVDASVVSREIEGMTEIDLDPKKCNVAATDRTGRSFHRNSPLWQRRQCEKS